MTPGDIAMLLNETAGLRVQPTAPSLGGASVRIQGLRGRYTQILTDGMPLYGGQAGALGPLQVPPMDLARVEVIKGAASALYGPTALGGVVNLVSRRPEPARELILNQSTLGGTDVVGWLADGLHERWGYTLLAGGHRQDYADVNSDGWADVPKFGRVSVRPRVFFDDGSGTSAMLTVGGMLENRTGGTLPGSRTPAGTEHVESLDSRRIDMGFSGQKLFSSRRILAVRTSGSFGRGGVSSSEGSDPFTPGAGESNRSSAVTLLSTSSAGRPLAVPSAAQEDRRCPRACPRPNVHRLRRPVRWR